MYIVYILLVRTSVTKYGRQILVKNKRNRYDKNMTNNCSPFDGVYHDDAYYASFYLSYCSQYFAYGTGCRVDDVVGVINLQVVGEFLGTDTLSYQGR